jgi:hypothetical protein
VIDAAVSPMHAFVDALAVRDYDAIESTLAPEVRFRALIPPGVREAASRSEARGYVQTWFGDADEFEIIERTIDTVGEVHHAGYRIHLREDGVRYVVQQHVFATVSDRGIETLDLMCSGFRPR